MSSQLYVLKDQKVFTEPDVMKWSKWYEVAAHRIVKQEWVENIWVSTVFLGLNHNFLRRGPPVLWETMTFSNIKEWDRNCWRCPGTWEQAEAQHNKVVSQAKKYLVKHKPNKG